ADTQIYDILIKRGRLVNDETDIALAGGRIARIAHRLPAAHARLVIEAEGYDVTTTGNGPCGDAPAPGVTPVEGATADIALVEIAGQERRCILAIRGGRVIFDSAGLSIPDVSRAGPYSNFK